MSVKGLRAPSLALAYEDWTAPQAAGPINNLLQFRLASAWASDEPQRICLFHERIDKFE